MSRKLFYIIKKSVKENYFTSKCLQLTYRIIYTQIKLQKFKKRKGNLEYKGQIERPLLILSHLGFHKLKLKRKNS